MIAGPQGSAKILGINPNTLRSRMEKLVEWKNLPPATSQNLISDDQRSRQFLTRCFKRRSHS